ncbi:MAG: transcriptional repressor NrdR [Betaproteobacteria bacterium]|nr:transcriptional repressor NrdR [Betaproteobacteria bacterium]
MRCPFCDGADTQVIDTRNSDEGDSIRRRRRCSHCDKRFTTFERIELNLPVVVKKNGARVEFDRRKLRASIALALRKRPISAEQMDATLLRILERYDAVTPKYIVTMSDGTRHMCNAAREVFYTRLPNGDVEPAKIDPTATVVSEKIIRSHKVAVETLREWYAQA